MTSKVLVPALALLFVSCVRQVQDTSVHVPSRPAPKPAAKTAVDLAIERHVRNALDAGDSDVRLMALRRKVAANPEDLQARMDLAKAYLDSGFPDMAVEHYRAAASRFPNSAEIVIQLAKTLRMMQLPRESKAALEQFIARSAEPSADALSWLGILQDESGEYVLAEKSYRAALEKQPGSDALHNNLGYNLLLQGRNQEAAAEFRRALEIAPASVLARYNLGLAMVSDSQDAMLSWQSVDDRATAHNNLAAMLIQKGSYAEARRQLQLALGYKHDHQAALKNLELVSELDGGAVALSWPLANAFWRRFLYILIGDNPPKSVGGMVSSASQ